MPVKQKIQYDSGHFFITFTCYNWLSLIEMTNSYDLIYNWFDVLKKQGHYITGYVIMYVQQMNFVKQQKVSTQ